MIKYVILVSTLSCLAYSQRPTYAGTAGRYPVVLPQYTKTPAPTEGNPTEGNPTVGNPTVGNPTVGMASVGNRIDLQNGEAGIASAAAAPAYAAIATTTAVPLNLPVEAYGDVDLINRIKTWPREKQPFWYINQQHLNAHRGSVNVAGSATVPPQPISRSFFTG